MIHGVVGKTWHTTCAVGVRDGTILGVTRIEPFGRWKDPSQPGRQGIICPIRSLKNRSRMRPPGQARNCPVTGTRQQGFWEQDGMGAFQVQSRDRRLAIVGGQCQGVVVLEECCQTGHWLCASLVTGDLFFVRGRDLSRSLVGPDDSQNAIAAAAHVSRCLHDRLGE